MWYAHSMEGGILEDTYLLISYYYNIILLCGTHTAWGEAYLRTLTTQSCHAQACAPSASAPSAAAASPLF